MVLMQMHTQYSGATQLTCIGKFGVRSQMIYLFIHLFIYLFNFFINQLILFIYCI